MDGLWVWDLATNEGRPLTGHQRWVTGALMFPHERVLSWSADGMLTGVGPGDRRSLLDCIDWWATECRESA
jgi:hypothetical protein